MRNIRLTIEYDGTRFLGWQAQSNTKKLKTVQGEIEKAASRLFGRKARLKGAGRTDSGVHAEAQAANFKIDSNLPLYNITKGLNSYLPSDIAIISAEDVPLDFHSRFDAREKLYRYTIVNRKVRSPLLMRYAAMCSYDLDIGAMKKAAGYLIGKKDFKSFKAADKKESNSIRHIKRLDIITKQSSIIEIYIQADGFLYNMVRNIAGTLIDVGRGRIRPEAVKDILKKRHRPAAGQTAPAKGLCLVKVFY
ncbi:MAG: tRNA pseudouridine(38-40) synthase TruA [Candidatus Omnitrophota bacterium]